MGVMMDTADETPLVAPSAPSAAFLAFYRHNKSGGRCGGRFEGDDNSFGEEGAHRLGAGGRGTGGKETGHLFTALGCLSPSDDGLHFTAPSFTS